VVDVPWIHTPAILYWEMAQAIARELESQGILVDQAQAQALARAQLGPPVRWADEEPTLSPEGLEILERIAQARDHDPYREQRQAQEPDQDPGQGRRPRGLRGIVPDRSGNGSANAIDQGQGGN
jgi:hypothetical protein